MSLLYTKVGKLLSYHLYVFVFLLYFYKISLVYSFFTVFSRKQQKSLSYAKRLRTTTPIFVEEIRKQVKYGLLQHTLLGRTYQYDYPFFQFRKGAVAQWVVTVVGSIPACSTSFYQLKVKEDLLQHCRNAPLIHSLPITLLKTQCMKKD